VSPCVGKTVKCEGLLRLCFSSRCYESVNGDGLTFYGACLNILNKTTRTLGQVILPKVCLIIGVTCGHTLIFSKRVCVQCWFVGYLKQMFQTAECLNV
jgi:hypothetical protein